MGEVGAPAPECRVWARRACGGAGRLAPGAGWWPGSGLPPVVLASQLARAVAGPATAATPQTHPTNRPAPSPTSTLNGPPRPAPAPPAAAALATHANSTTPSWAQTWARPPARPTPSRCTTCSTPVAPSPWPTLTQVCGCVWVAGWVGGWVVVHLWACGVRVCVCGVLCGNPGPCRGQSGVRCVGSAAGWPLRSSAPCDGAPAGCACATKPPAPGRHHP